MLRDAFRSVHENLGALLLFVAFAAPMSLGVAVLNEFYIEPQREELGPQTIGLIQTGVAVAQGFVYAVAASLVFSRLAASIDRPLWKVHGAGDALSRFFSMWLLLFFVAVAMIQFGVIAFERGSENFGGVLQFLGVLFLITVIPFGAIVTFLGNARGEDVQMALRILPRVADRFLLAMLIGFVQVGVIQSLMVHESTEYWMKPMISAGDAYIDCVVFSYVFLACREQRDLEEPVDPYDL